MRWRESRGWLNQWSSNRCSRGEGKGDEREREGEKQGEKGVESGDRRYCSFPCQMPAPSGLLTPKPTATAMPMIKTPIKTLTIIRFRRLR